MHGAGCAVQRLPILHCGQGCFQCGHLDGHAIADGRRALHHFFQLPVAADAAATASRQRPFGSRTAGCGIACAYIQQYTFEHGPHLNLHDIGRICPAFGERKTVGEILQISRRHHHHRERFAVVVHCHRHLLGQQIPCRGSDAGTHLRDRPARMAAARFGRVRHCPRYLARRGSAPGWICTRACPTWDRGCPVARGNCLPGNTLRWSGAGCRIPPR